MADIDNEKGEVLRVLQEDSVDNMRGVTQRTIEENTINNLRGVTKRVYVVGGGGTPINNQDISVTANGTYTADEGYTGLGTVSVNVPNPSTGTMYIISNGTYNVSDKAIANVNVPTTAPTYYIEKTIDAQGKLISGTSHIMNFSGVKNVSDYALYGQYYQNTNISGAISFPDLTRCDGKNGFTSAFYGCTGITSVDLSALQGGSGNSGFTNAFYGCTGITSVDLSALQSTGANLFSYAFSGCTNLTTVTIATNHFLETNANQVFASAFTNCTALTTIDLSYLTSTSGGNSVFNYAFNGCTNLTTVKLDSLYSLRGTQVFYGAFQNCTALQSLSFPSLTSTSFGSNSNQFSNMLNGVTGCTLHFPSNIQAKIETLTGYPNFGGTNTTVLFDLPATVILTGANSAKYERYPREDTATALCWKAQYTNIPTTPYYTSGTTDPQVNDTIYSDSACTVAVTTISSIA